MLEHVKQNSLHVAAAFERTAERAFVGIFQVAAHGQTACQACHRVDPSGASSPFM